MSSGQRVSGAVEKLAETDTVFSETGDAFLAFWLSVSSKCRRQTCSNKLLCSVSGWGAGTEYKASSYGSGGAR